MATVTVAEAAWKLRKSYQSTLRLLFIGELRGRRTSDGHYQVESASVEEFERRRARASGDQSAPAGTAA